MTTNPTLDQLAREATTALITQRILIGNDLCSLRDRFEKAVPATPQDAASINRRAGRIEALLYILRSAWGQERFARFCETVHIEKDELSETFIQETDSLRDHAGEAWNICANLDL